MAFRLLCRASPYDVPIRPVPAAKQRSPRGKRRKPKNSSFCSQCGYMLASDSECRVCARLRVDFLQSRDTGAERLRSSRTIASNTAVIRNRALRTSRPRSTLSGMDGTAVRSTTVAPESQQRATVQVTNRPGTSASTSAMARRQTPTQQIRPVMPDPPTRAPAASWLVPWWLVPAVVLLGVIVFFLWVWR
jgi:hypothetical protein